MSWHAVKLPRHRTRSSKVWRPRNARGSSALDPRATPSPYFPSPVFRDLHALLSSNRSARRHAALRREAEANVEQDPRVEDGYRAIEKEGAGTLARRIVSHETEYFVRQIWHDAAPAFSPISAALKLAHDALDAPALDRAAIREQLARTEERAAFLQHVLETARSHAKAIVPAFRDEDLGKILRDEVALLQTRFSDRAARLDVDTSKVEAPLVAEVDASFLRQAIGNILKNAVEAHDAQPTDPQIARAFVPFGSAKPGGTGLGLFTARRTARLVHGGDLRIASHPGEGTTVTMTLRRFIRAGRRRSPSSCSSRRRG